MTTFLQTEQHAALAEHHRRLSAAALAVVEDAREGDADHALVAAHLLRILKRELRHEPQPQTLTWMSPS